jgi:hypothetical protein
MCRTALNIQSNWRPVGGCDPALVQAELALRGGFDPFATRVQMTGACADLPYQAEFGMAETEAKRKLLAASMCFRRRRPPPYGRPLLTPAIEG